MKFFPFIMLLAWLLASPALSQTFTMVPASVGEASAITANGSHVVAFDGTNCVVRNLSTGVNDVIPIFGGRTIVSCDDIRHSLFGGHVEVLANTTTVTGTQRGQMFSKAPGFWVEIVNPSSADWIGRVNELGESEPASSIWSAGGGYPLMGPAAPGTPAMNLAGTATFPPRAFEPLPEVGEFFGLSPDNQWAVGKMYDAPILADRPFFVDASSNPGFKLLTFDSFREGWPNAVASPIPSAPSGFEAVGEADRMACVGMPQVCTVTRSAIHWVGVEDTPNYLRHIGQTAGPSRALALNRDASIAVGSSAGEAVVWDDPRDYGHASSFMRPLAGSEYVPAGWTLTETTDVSLDSDVFVGKGTFNGVARNWVIDLQGTPVPEPAFASSLAIAALIFGLLASPAKADDEIFPVDMTQEDLEAFQECFELEDENELNACVEELIEELS